MQREPDRLHAAGAGRLRLLERRLPLDPGRRRAVRLPVSRDEARRAAARAVRRLRQQRARAGGGRGGAAGRALRAAPRRLHATARSTARRRRRRRRSKRAGWRDVRASLFDAPVPVRRRDEDAALYVKTILLRDHVARLPEDLRRRLRAGRRRRDGAAVGRAVRRRLRAAGPVGEALSARRPRSRHGVERDGRSSPTLGR